MPDTPQPQDEARKFQAETITSTFLADRLRRRKVLCDRCSHPGMAVLVGQGDQREWLCGSCLGSPEPQLGPVRF